MNQTYITLNNGTKIPQFGMGVYMVPAGGGDEENLP
jgi:diketogulonate reductase-like aldo/keto reductase